MEGLELRCVNGTPAVRQERARDLVNVIE